MNVLQERVLNPQVRTQAPMLEAGGLWWAPADAAPATIVAEARERHVHALELQSRSIDFVEALPALEFLHLHDLHDPEPLYALKNLRVLRIAGTWQGRIDFQRLPCLEAFSVVECPRDEGGLDTLFEGHGRLRELSIQRFRRRDFAALASLALETLYLAYSRTLTSMTGLDSLAPTLRRLGLYACPNLSSLDGLRSLSKLETLEVGSLRRLKTLEFVRTLPHLRLLDVFELAGVESLKPLAGHAGLEFLSFGRVRDLDLGPLTEMPRLKLYLTGYYRWNRRLELPPHAHSLEEDHPLIWEWRSLQI